MRLRRFVLVSIAVVALLGTAFAITRTFYQRPLHRYCSEFTIAFSAEGSEFTLQSVVISESYRGGPLSYGGVAFRNYPRLVGKRLPSGAGVAFNVPFDEMSTLRDRQANRDGPDLLPYTYWFDDADKPSLMEVYISELYNDAPSGRVRVNAISAKQLPECKPSDPVNEIAWLQRPLDERAMYGLFAYVVPEQEWRKHLPLAECLSQLDRFDAVPDDWVDEAQLSSVLGGRAPAWGGPSVLLRVAGRKVLDQPLHDRPANEFLRPVSVEGTALTLHLDEPGKLVYYPGGLKAAGSADLRIGSVQVRVKLSEWHFDPLTQTLFKIQHVTF